MRTIELIIGAASLTGFVLVLYVLVMLFVSFHYHPDLQSLGTAAMVLFPMMLFVVGRLEDRQKDGE